MTLAAPLEPGLSAESRGLVGGGVVVKTKGGGGERSSGLDSMDGEGASDSGCGGEGFPKSAGGVDVKLSSSKPDIIINTSLVSSSYFLDMYTHFSHLQLDRFQPKTILSRSNTIRYPDIKFSAFHAYSQNQSIYI